MAVKSVEVAKLQGEYRISYEKLRHKNIMEELKFMTENNLKFSPRGHPAVEISPHNNKVLS